MIYLDCNATTPMDPEVLDVVIRCLHEEVGNASSRTHEFGLRAKKLVERAREHIARVVDARPEEVIFTSGATESNNLALLGLQEEAVRSRRMHIVSSRIEHKAVLEPLQQLSRKGFEITLVDANPSGAVDANAVASAVRSDTLLVSLMHVNNETGVVQPIDKVAAALAKHDCYIHVDAAQGFGKELNLLKDSRIDLISASGHKVYGPKGVGALICRIRRGERPPIRALQFGGGQEHGLRAGTVPVPLIAGFGEAARTALRDGGTRAQRCADIKRAAMDTFLVVGALVNGSVDQSLPTTLNLSFPGCDAEAVMLLWKDLVAVSNGSACTSAGYAESHVLTAMHLTDDRVRGAVRLSWSHLTPDVPWEELAARVQNLM